MNEMEMCALPSNLGHLARHCIMLPLPATSLSRNCNITCPPTTHPFFLHLLLSLSSSLSFSSPSPTLSCFSAASMAVQARNPPSNLADLRNRPYELLMNGVANADPCDLLAPSTYDNLNNFHQVLPTHYHQQILQPGFSPTMIPNYVMFQPQWPAAHAPAHTAVMKKRRKESSKVCADKRPRHQQVHQLTSCAPALPSILKSEDAHSTISISRPNLGASLFSTVLSDGLSAQISKQQDDIIELLKIQTEQLRLVIEERVRSHSKAFLVNVGEWLSCKLRDRNEELERVNQKNLELEEKVNYLSLETRAWQSKAWSYDTMASVLRANLQQILMQQSRCQGKMEGCGDSNDDAASAIIAKDAQQTRTGLAVTHNRATQRTCKKCKSKEMSVLLLPCLHLSLCSDCKEIVERCPTCNFHITECVEVYLS